MERSSAGWISAQEACERTGLSMTSLCNYVKAGRLARRKEGRRAFYVEAEVGELAIQRARGMQEWGRYWARTWAAWDKYLVYAFGGPDPDSCR